MTTAQSDTAEVPEELTALLESDRDPANVHELKDWCEDCRQLLTPYERDDALLPRGESTPYRELAANLMRLVTVFVRRYVSEEKAADELEFPGKILQIKLFLAKLRLCMKWCDEKIGPMRQLEQTYQAASWDEVSIAVDALNGNFYAIPNRVIDGNQFNLVDATRLPISQPKLQGLLKAFAQNAMDGKTISRKEAYVAMPVAGRQKSWDENDNALCKVLRQRVSDRSANLREEYISIPQGSRGPFSYKKSTDKVTSSFRVLLVTVQGDEKAILTIPSQLS